MGTPDRTWLERFLNDVSLSLIVLHLILAIIFLEDGFPPMSAVNLASLVANGIGLCLLRKGLFRIYMLTLYCVELLSLVLSTLCVGWSAGFQLPLLGLTALLFLCEILGRSLGLAFPPALPLGVINFAVYVLTFPVFFYRPGLLAVPQETAYKVALCWSIPVFASVVFGMVSVLRLTSDSERSLTNKAETDELTGLYNRAGYDRLCAELNPKTTTLVLVDADKFKGINDNFGHETGDRVLKKVARTLRTNFRRSDYVCRIGGDEFAVLIPGKEEPDEKAFQNKIAQINLELARADDSMLPHISISVGVAHGGGAENWTSLFKQADDALYQVKQAGRGGCRFYHA